MQANAVGNMPYGQGAWQRRNAIGKRITSTEQWDTWEQLVDTVFVRTLEREAPASMLAQAVGVCHKRTIKLLIISLDN